jgi:hypothetical protein
MGKQGAKGLTAVTSANCDIELSRGPRRIQPRVYDEELLLRARHCEALGMSPLALLIEAENAESFVEIWERETSAPRLDPCQFERMIGARKPRRAPKGEVSVVELAELPPLTASEREGLERFRRPHLPFFTTGAPQPVSARKTMDTGMEPQELESFKQLKGILRNVNRALGSPRVRQALEFLRAYISLHENKAPTLFENEFRQSTLDIGKAILSPRKNHYLNIIKGTRRDTENAPARDRLLRIYEEVLQLPVSNRDTATERKMDGKYTSFESLKRRALFLKRRLGQTPQGPL